MKKRPKPFRGVLLGVAAAALLVLLSTTYLLGPQGKQAGQGLAGRGIAPADTRLLPGVPVSGTVAAIGTSSITLTAASPYKPREEVSIEILLGPETTLERLTPVDPKQAGAQTEPPTTYTSKPAPLSSLKVGQRVSVIPAPANTPGGPIAAQHIIVLAPL